MDFNTFSLILISSVILLGAGVFLIKYPKTMRNFDTKMTLYVKDENDYIQMCRMFGMLFIFISLSVF